LRALVDADDKHSATRIGDVFAWLSIALSLVLFGAAQRKPHRG
jgi:hypothetical protein